MKKLDLKIKGLKGYLNFNLELFVCNIVILLWEILYCVLFS